MCRLLLRNLFEQTYCRLRPSPIHGVGVFAIRAIPTGVDPFEGCFRGQSTRLTEAVFRPFSMRQVSRSIRPWRTHCIMDCVPWTRAPTLP